MNILFMPEMVTMTEGAGGLFDFNATLPLMAILFVLLDVVLTFIYFKPISKGIAHRENYINDKLTTASEKLIKANDLYNDYGEHLKTARVNAQEIIAQSEKQAKEFVALEMKHASDKVALEMEIHTSLLELQKNLFVMHVRRDKVVNELSLILSDNKDPITYL